MLNTSDDNMMRKKKQKVHFFIFTISLHIISVSIRIQIQIPWSIGFHQDLLFFKFQSYVSVKLRSKEQCKQRYFCQFYYSGTYPKIEFTDFFLSKSRTLACFKTA
jgi:hypothetical protein